MKWKARACASFGLFLLFAFGIQALAQAAPPVSSWPSTDCADEDYWLVFAELEICLDRSDVHRIEHKNVPSPSVVLQLDAEGRTIDVTLSRLDDRMITGGLHDHLDMGVMETFDLLLRTGDDEKHVLARQVMDVDGDATTVSAYENDQSRAYALVREPNSYSSIFILRADREGGIKIGGEFDQKTVERLLSVMRH